MSDDGYPDFRYWRTVRDAVLSEIRAKLGIAAELTGPLFNAVERGVIDGIKRAETMLANPGSRAP